MRVRGVGFGAINECVLDLFVYTALYLYNTYRVVLYMYIEMKYDPRFNNTIK